MLSKRRMISGFGSFFFPLVRHSVGQYVVSVLGRLLGVTWRDSGRYQAALAFDSNLVLVRPKSHTYPDAAKFIGAAARDYEVPVQNVTIILPDIHSPLGTVRETHSSTSGHSEAVVALQRHFSTEPFTRIVFGLRPSPELNPDSLLNFHSTSIDHAVGFGSPEQLQHYFLYGRLPDVESQVIVREIKELARKMFGSQIEAERQRQHIERIRKQRSASKAERAASQSTGNT